MDAQDGYYAIVFILDEILASMRPKCALRCEDNRERRAERSTVKHPVMTATIPH